MVDKSQKKFKEDILKITGGFDKRLKAIEEEIIPELSSIRSLMQEIKEEKSKNINTDQPTSSLIPMNTQLQPNIFGLTSFVSQELDTKENMQSLMKDVVFVMNKHKIKGFSFFKVN